MTTGARSSGKLCLNETNAFPRFPSSRTDVYLVAQLLQGARKVRGETAHSAEEVWYVVGPHDHLGSGRQSLVPDADLPRAATEAVGFDIAEGLVVFAQ